MVSERFREALPHYLAMMLSVWVVLGGVRVTYGRQPAWLEVVLIAGICLSYILAVRWLGYAPEAWRNPGRENP